MKTLEMSITPDYVPHWDISAALREFLQNALDSQREGNSLEISTSENFVHLTNYGATLPLKTLLLGSSTKADETESIGQFGEGYKLGCLVLVREEINISISSSEGTLYPEIIHSENYKTKILSFLLDEEKKFPAGVQISFGEPITESWLRSLVLLDDPYTPRILKDRPGQVYLNGLQINLEKPTKTEDHWHWGYNLPPTLKLDRDRMMVHSSSLLTHVLEVIFESATIKDIYNAIKKPIPEIKDSEVYHIPRDKDRQILDMFKDQNGENSYALWAMFASDKDETVKYAGLNPIKVDSKPLINILRRSQDSWDSIESKAKEKLHAFEKANLSLEEEKIFKKAKTVLKQTNFSHINITPVIFTQTDLRGLISKGEIYISVKCFATVGELISTIVHEAIHEEKKSHDKHFWQEFENKIGEVLTSIL